MGMLGALARIAGERASAALASMATRQLRQILGWMSDRLSRTLHAASVRALAAAPLLHALTEKADGPTAGSIARNMRVPLVAAAAAAVTTTGLDGGACETAGNDTHSAPGGSGCNVHHGEGDGSSLHVIAALGSGDLPAFALAPTTRGAVGDYTQVVWGKGCSSPAPSSNGLIIGSSEHTLHGVAAMQWFNSPLLTLSVGDTTKQSCNLVTSSWMVPSQGGQQQSTEQQGVEECFLTTLQWGPYFSINQHPSIQASIFNRNTNWNTHYDYPLSLHAAQAPCQWVATGHDALLMGFFTSARSRAGTANIIKRHEKNMKLKELSAANGLVRMTLSTPESESELTERTLMDAQRCIIHLMRGNETEGTLDSESIEPSTWSKHMNAALKPNLNRLGCILGADKGHPGLKAAVAGSVWSRLWGIPPTIVQICSLFRTIPRCYVKWAIRIEDIMTGDNVKLLRSDYAANGVLRTQLSDILADYPLSRLFDDLPPKQNAAMAHKLMSILGICPPRNLAESIKSVWESEDLSESNRLLLQANAGAASDLMSSMPRVHDPMKQLASLNMMAGSKRSAPSPAGLGHESPDPLGSLVAAMESQEYGASPEGQPMLNVIQSMHSFIRDSAAGNVRIDRDHYLQSEAMRAFVVKLGNARVLPHSTCVLSRG